VLASSFLTCFTPDSPTPFSGMEVGQAPVEVVGAGQAAMRLSTPFKMGGLGPDITQAAFAAGNEEAISQVSADVSAVSAEISKVCEEGWTLVPTKLKGNPDKAINAPVPVDRAPPSFVKGASKSNVGKGKTPVKNSAGPSTSKPVRPVPSSTRTKTWYDPDDLDAERGSREERTVKIVLPPGTKGLTRASFAARVSETVGLRSLEACGPAAAPNIWLLTFVTKDDKEHFAESGDFITPDGLMARVHSKKNASKFWIKVHWVPYEVPMANALRQLETVEGLKIIAASYDKVTGSEGLAHVRSLLRSVLVETDNPQNVPYILRWNHEDTTGVALVTVKGRPPICLRCNTPGHVRKDCVMERCTQCAGWGHNIHSCTKKRGYAAVVGGAPIISEEVDLIDEDRTDMEVTNSAGNTRDTNQPQLDSLQGLQALEAMPVDCAMSTCDRNAQSNETPEDPDGRSWADRSEDEIIITSLGKFVSPLLTSDSSGESGGESTEMSVAYESPSTSGGSEKSFTGVQNTPRKQRATKRERERTGSTQSPSPKPKK
jgi:hypothetical protein